QGPGALPAAHERGTVHRDIKPGNILLRRPSGEPVLVDFGLAVGIDHAGLTRTGHSAGYTALFAAPEQLRGRPADARSDVYSLAASLHYALRYSDCDGREPDQFEPDKVEEPFRDLLRRGRRPRPAERAGRAAGGHPRPRAA